jgi:BirA family biotin operon repressor/biotin-[acetyl-CoA-carboxylase] ligase
VGGGAVTSYDGESERALAARWKVPRCVVFDRVSSTLDVLHELAGQGAPSGTTVLADEQLSGRGRHGRPWHSPPGRGVWLGFLAHPEDAGAVGLVALRVGLAAARSLEAIGAAVRLKWPNDLMLEDRKLGGVLCEARWHGTRPAWVAVGVGLNVHGPVSESLRGAAIALDEVCRGVSRLEVLDGVLGGLRSMPQRPCLDDGELAAYASRDWLRGRRILQPTAGRPAGIGEDGALLVETESGHVERVIGGTVVAA